MNTGGGTVAASQEIARMVDDFDSDKPIVVSMGDTTASGGYYIASQADRIVAQPGTLTGSIGVIWTTFDYAGLLDKVGIELDTVTAGKHKDMFLPGRMTPERRLIVQNLVDDSYEQFVAAVVNGRGLTDAAVRSLATGQLYTGEDALRLRLVDELGGLEKAIKEAERLAGVTNAQIIEPTPSIWDAFFGGPGINSLSETVGAFLIGPDVLVLREFLNSYPSLRY
jgi:protease-4